MSSKYEGVAPLTMARTSSGGYVNIYAGDPVPEGVDKADLDRLLDEGFFGEVKAEPESEPESAKPASVESILAEVGDDRVKAQAALDEELARGDAARSTLIKKLQAVVEA